MARFESGNIFSAVIEGVSVSAAQDIFQVTAGAKPVLIHRIEVGQDTSETSEVLPIRVRRGIGATAGSGGASVTAQRLKPGAGTATAAVVRNNTTVATAGSGSLVTLVRRTFNVVTGWIFEPASEDRIVLGADEILVVHLPTAPSGALTVSAEIVFEEIG